VIVVSNSSPLITLARAKDLDLLKELYKEIYVPVEVHHEVTIAGAGLPGADEVQHSTWIRVQPLASEVSESIKAVCAGLGSGERNAIYLASGLRAQLVLIDEERARRAAKAVGLLVAGSVAVPERGAQAGRIADLRSVYLSLLEQGIRFDHKLLDESLGRLGLPKLIA
jgi:uncharacterized protein